MNELRQNELRQIKKIQEIDFPQDLHGRIMRSLYLRQFKLPLVVINALLMLNLSLSGWHLMRSLQAGTEVSGTGAFLVRTWEFLATIAGEDLQLLLLNTALLAVGVYLFLKLNRAIPGSRSGLKQYVRSEVQP